MPIQIKPNEEKDDFIQRCISEEMSYGKSESQSVAICYSYWESVIGGSFILGMREPHMHSG